MSVPDRGAVAFTIPGEIEVAVKVGVAVRGIGVSVGGSTVTIAV
jgi:hypothetical protein